MKKRTIELGLNKFSGLPPSLVVSGTKESVRTLPVEVKAVLHHYFVAKFGDSSEDNGTYEYERFLTAGTDWRFRGSGIGTDKEAKRNASNELGKGFARWFLYEHFGFTYFCPFEDLVDRTNGDGSKWVRIRDGDLPDYVCGESKFKLNLLEAKGRYHSVTFQTKEFNDFRAQIQRAGLVDASGAAIRVKGFISAARWATEDSPRVRSTLLVEDPVSDGRPPSADGFPPSIGLAMVLGHYALILEKLRLPLHADAIRLRRQIPEQTGARRGIWECIAGPLSGRRFVGGFAT